MIHLARARLCAIDSIHDGGFRDAWQRYDQGIRRRLCFFPLDEDYEAALESKDSDIKHARWLAKPATSSRYAS